MAKILFITTSADSLAGNPTGIWYEELATPYYILQVGGNEIDIASPSGGRPPFDPKAFEPDAVTPSVERFQADLEAQEKLNNTDVLSEVNFSDYDAIFFPGGHGAAVDLPFDETLAKNLGKFFDSGKPVAAVCHGPAALVSGKKSDGKSIVYGRNVSSFTNAEEEAVGATNSVPFLMEDKFAEQGGNFVCGENFSEFAIADGNLITGQNPASSAKTAKLLLKAIG